MIGCSIIGAVSLASGWSLVSLAALVFREGSGVIMVNQVAFSSGRELVLTSTFS